MPLLFLGFWSAISSSRVALISGKLCTSSLLRTLKEMLTCPSTQTVDLMYRQRQEDDSHDRPPDHLDKPIFSLRCAQIFERYDSSLVRADEHLCSENDACTCVRGHVCTCVLSLACMMLQTGLILRGGPAHGRYENYPEGDLVVLPSLFPRTN